MFNKFVALTLTILCVAGVSRAQLPCSADKHYQRLLQKYPQLADYEDQFEAQIQKRIGARTTSVPVDTNTYDIPLVVHVIHDYGTENISDDILYDAASYWADIYMLRNADTVDVIPPFLPYIGNPKIRLHLATKDPNGHPTKGIDRVQSYLTMNADDEAKYNQWDPSKYVNIWFINTFGAAETGAAAYALLPSSAAYEPYYDGVISLASYANYAKVIPHELGHVLNLQHPWGNTNEPAVACGDDHVDDTPPTMGHNPVGCSPAALYDVTCAIGYTKTYTSSDGTLDSVVNYPDTVNAQNIMDYTYCQRMFTKGQAVRMRTALTGPTAGRNNLYTPANLAATGALAPMPDLPPIADFILNKASGGGSIYDNRSYFLTFNNLASFNFMNASWNDTISSVAWTFSNGATTPTSAATGVVSNKFSVPGWVSVSLTANSNAGSNTLTNNHAVYAADTASIGGNGYFQNFTAAADIANWPMFNYYNNQFKWDFYTGAGLGDNTCIRYRSFDTSQRITGIAIGDHDDFFTPAFNLAGLSGNLFVDFFTSGAYTTAGIGPYDPNVTDSLVLEASTSGGARWTKIASIYGSDLANNGDYGVEFAPTNAGQWVARSVSIPAAYRTNNTFFRFQYWPGNEGNNLYLDKFSISSDPAGVKELLTSDNSFNIYPNPATNGCFLVFKTGISGIVNYSIKDLTGKVVYQEQKSFAPNTTEQQSIPRSLTPAAGMYFVTVTVEGNSMTQKMVIY